MNPLTVLPAAARRWLYLVYAVCGPVLLWTRAKGWTGANELELWAGLGTALGLVAAANTTDATAVKDDDSPTGEVATKESDIAAGTPVQTIPGTVPADPLAAPSQDYVGEHRASGYDGFGAPIYDDGGSPATPGR